MAADLLKVNEFGLYCAAGDFYIDPWRSVPKALITHGHSDHARYGCSKYLSVNENKWILKARLGNQIDLTCLNYGESILINGIKVTFHPSGHLLGGSQIEVEQNGNTWVVSGDYKTQSDPTCRQFIPIKCHTFISECTFGLPIYRWQSSQQIIHEIQDWWKTNAALETCSILGAYSLGKAQRILASLGEFHGPIFVHGAVQKINQAYLATGISLPETNSPRISNDKKVFQKALVIAPPSALNSSWSRRFGKSSMAVASGWCAVRGNRRRRGLEKGFVLSDHADWGGLIDSIKSTNAERVLLTHGFTSVFSRYLLQHSVNAEVLSTHYEGETDLGDGNDMTESSEVVSQ